MNDYYMYYGLTSLAFFLTFGAQMYIQSVYNKYGNIHGSRSYRGAEVARDILNKNDLESVNVQKMAGFLTDRYDPNSRNVILSQSNYDSDSIASVTVLYTDAAEEESHAAEAVAE